MAAFALAPEDRRGAICQRRGKDEQARRALLPPCSGGMGVFAFELTRKTVRTPPRSRSSIPSPVLGGACKTEQAKNKKQTKSKLK